MPICAIYARVSTDHQGDSVDNQVSLMTAYAQHQGSDWVIDDRFIYRDDGKSGTSIVDREAVIKLVSDAQDGMFNVVLFKGISRFARDIVDAVNMLRALRSVKVRIISYEENFDSQQGDSDLIFQIHASVAEHESKKIGIRTKLGHRETAKRGRWAKGRPPFGYVIDSRTKKLVPHPDQAPVVKLVFDMYVNKGIGMVSIARYLNEHGIKTNFDGLWSQVTVRLLLRNEVYLGRIAYGIRRNDIEYDRKTHERKTVVSRNNDEDIIRVDGAHPELVDEYTYYLAQEISKSRRVNRTGGELYMLSGILKCANCGTGMISHTQNRKRADGRRVHELRYDCGKRRKYGKEQCDGSGYQAKYIEPLVLNNLKKELTSVDLTQLRNVVMLNLNGQSTNSEVLDSTTRQIKEIESQLINANMKNSKGIIDDKSLSVIMRELNIDKEKLEKFQVQLIAKIRNDDESEKQVDVFIRAIYRFLKLDKIDDDNRAEANAILRQLVDYIVVDDNKKVICKLKFNIHFAT